jgi:hypothetical protein
MGHVLGLVWEVLSLPFAFLRIGRGVHSGVHQIPPQATRTGTDASSEASASSGSGDPARDERQSRQRERVRALFAKANWDNDSESSDHLALS